MNIGKAIVTLRRENGLSQEGLAHEAEISRHYMYKLENNKASPTVHMLERIAKILDTPVSAIITLAETLS